MIFAPSANQQRFKLLISFCFLTLLASLRVRFSLAQDDGIGAFSEANNGVEIVNSTTIAQEPFGVTDAALTSAQEVENNTTTVVDVTRLPETINNATNNETTTATPLRLVINRPLTEEGVSADGIAAAPMSIMIIQPANSTIQIENATTLASSSTDTTAATVLLTPTDNTTTATATTEVFSTNLTASPTWQPTLSPISTVNGFNTEFNIAVNNNNKTEDVDVTTTNNTTELETKSAFNNQIDPGENTPNNTAIVFMPPPSSSTPDGTSTLLLADDQVGGLNDQHELDLRRGQFGPAIISPSSSSTKDRNKTSGETIAIIILSSALCFAVILLGIAAIFGMRMRQTKHRRSVDLYTAKQPPMYVNTAATTAAAQQQPVAMEDANPYREYGQYNDHLQHQKQQHHLLSSPMNGMNGGDRRTLTNGNIPINISRVPPTVPDRSGRTSRASGHSGAVDVDRRTTAF